MTRTAKSGCMQTPLLTTAACLCSLLAGCGGGGSDDGSDDDPPAQLTGYAVGGTVSGLNGSPVTLWLRGHDEQTVPANGSFSMQTRLNDGAQYVIEVRTQPSNPEQFCRVDNGHGQIAGSDITNVSVVCEPAFKVGGTMNNSTGSPVQLSMGPTLDADPVSNTLPIEMLDVADGGFEFLTALPPSANYVVNALPTERQRCEVENGRGTIGTSDVGNVAVTCEPAFTVSAEVSGLQGSSLALQLTSTSANVVRQAFVQVNGPVLVGGGLGPGDDYLVQVAEQPANPEQICTVTSRSGTITDADVTNVVVQCFDPEREFPARQWQMYFGPSDDPRSRVLAESPSYPAWSRDTAGLHEVEAGTLWPDAWEEDDDIALGQVYSGNLGRTLRISATAPHDRSEDTGELIVRYAQRQSYRKLSNSSRLQVYVPHLHLSLIEDERFDPGPGEDALLATASVAGFVFAGTEVDDEALSLSAKTLSARLEGRHTDWRFISIAHDYELDASQQSGFFDYERYARAGSVQSVWARLVEPLAMDLDVSQIPVGAEFTVELSARVHARDSLGPDLFGSFAGAELSDRIRGTGVTPIGAARKTALSSDADAMVVLTTDLEATNRPFLGEPTRPTPPSPTCPSDADPVSGGTLQFSVGSYTTAERSRSSESILITRTGGTEGVVEATLTTSDGTATAGTDYTSINRTIRFNDGDNVPRLVDLQLVYDTDVEADETLTLRLSSPRGCVELGEINTTELTIVNDDIAPPEAYTVGGTIAGLTGDGLVLRSGFDRIRPPAGATDFVFPTPIDTGLDYFVAVETQPANPAQICEVSNGRGAIENADVTNVIVTCTDAPPAPSGLDPTFGDNGLVYSELSVDQSGIMSMGLQSDGGIVIATRNVVTRYTAQGALDTTFGTNGVVSLDLGFSGNRIHDIAIQYDDGIVAVGDWSATSSSPGDLAVFRLTSQGVLDTTFGTAGRVTTDVLGGSDSALVVEIQPDGHILVGGVSYDTSTSYPTVVRYLPNGTLDPAWSDDGLQHLVGLQGERGLYAMTLMGDRVVVAGGHRNTNFLARLLPNGDPDLSLTGVHRECGIPFPPPLPTGWVHIDGGSGDEFPVDIVVNTTGRIFVATNYWDSGTPFGMTVTFDTGRMDHLCVTETGEQYDGFNDDGVTAPFGSGHRPYAMAMQSDGRIWIAGDDANDDFFLARFLTVDDPTTAMVNETGVVDQTHAIDFFGSTDGARAMVLQPDGRIVAVGTARNGTQTGLAIIRINP